MGKIELLAFCLHSTWTSIYAYAIYYDVNFVQLPGHNEPPRNYAGRWKYLTFWNAVLQLSFNAFCVVCDVSGSSRLIRLKDFVFATLVYPLSLFVCFTFWGLYFIDRNLVFPPILDQYFPKWLNQVLHTMILPTTLIELCLQPHAYPARRIGISFLLLFVFAYIYWTLHLALIAGVWVYPILQILTWPQRLVFYLLGISFFVSLYITGEKLNSSLWTKMEVKPEQRKMKQTTNVS